MQALPEGHWLQVPTGVALGVEGALPLVADGRTAAHVRRRDKVGADTPRPTESNGLHHLTVGRW